MRFGILVRETRESLRITQSQFAKDIGVSHGYVTKMERQGILPREYLVKKMAVVLKIAYPRLKRVWLLDRLPYPPVVTHWLEKNLESNGYRVGDHTGYEDFKAYCDGKLAALCTDAGEPRPSGASGPSVREVAEKIPAPPDRQAIPLVSIDALLESASAGRRAPTLDNAASVVLSSVHADGAFALKVDRDALVSEIAIPGIEHGDMLVLVPEEDPKPGDMVLSIGEEEARLARFYPQGGGTLVPVRRGADQPRSAGERTWILRVAQVTKEIPL